MNKLLKEAMDSLALVGIYTTDGYKFEDPKEIEKAIKELEKSDRPDMQYLMALKRALELAKAERATKDNDATENGAIEEFGQNKETEAMPLEKKPVLAQDSQNLKRMAYFRLLVSGDIINTPDGKVEIDKYDNVGFLGRNGKRYNWDDVAVYNKDEGPVYTFGGQFKKLDELEKEKLEVEGKLQELYDIRDGLLSGAKNTNSQKFNPIKQNIQNHENKLKAIENDIKRIKSGGKMSKDEKTYQNGEHIKIKWGSREGDLIEVKVLKDLGDKVTVKAPNGNVVDVPKIYIKDTLDECMEILRLSGVN